jgi:FixJ family two-component response regulator
VVVVIDDDESVRAALRGLFESVGLIAEGFGSVHDYLASNASEHARCIVLDIRLPGSSGLEFQDALARVESPPSVVVLSAHVDVQMAVRAMKAGAIDVLTKPVREQDLLEAVNRGIVKNEQWRAESRRGEELRARYFALTDRERQVITLVAQGLLNKQIAERVSVTEATVKLHRGQAMRKMRADSVADLVRMVDLLGNQPAEKSSRD